MCHTNRDAAWANGTVNKPDTSLPWMQKAVNEHINPNNLTVSIEHEGKTGETYNISLGHFASKHSLEIPHLFKLAIVRCHVLRAVH